jgi:pimeloyl-ACP methyl ester carboxylesterase
MHVNGLSLRVVDEGSGTPVLLLHGFPDSSYLWRHQIRALAGAGEGAGHWIPVDAPDRLNQLLLEFLTAGGGT